MKKNVLFTLILLLAGAATQAQNITVTIAGNGIAGYTGDGFSGKTAQLNGPKDVCLDAAKNIYLTDCMNAVVRKISATNGVITTIAGGGTSTLDGVPATNAMLSPKYMCLSPSGSLYITTGNQIRKINVATGIITTVAGSTASGYSGDGSAATAALLNNPTGITLDGAGNIYFVDRGNHAVRKITLSSGIITTLAGNGAGVPGNIGDGAAATAAKLYNPACICVNAGGDVFFSDQNPDYPITIDGSVTIRKINASDGIISSVAGDPLGMVSDVPATATLLGTITGMFCADNGDIYINEMSCTCRRIDHSTDSVFLIGGDFSTQGYTDDISSILANMDHPYGLYVDNMHNIYVADNGNQRIRKLIQLTHTPTFAYGKGQLFCTTPSTVTSLNDLLSVTTDEDGTYTETWTVLTPPTRGTLTGFPATAISNSIYQTTVSHGTLTYNSSLYGGADQFQIRVSDGSLSDTITVYVDNVGSFTTSVNTITPAPAMSIYPNPALSTLNIDLGNSPLQNNDVSITDVTDRLLYHSTVTSANNKSVQIDVSSFPAGIYMVHVNNIVAGKFVKE